VWSKYSSHLSRFDCWFQVELVVDLSQKSVKIMYSPFNVQEYFLTQLNKRAWAHNL
jgi:hypothetical protein